MTSTEKYALAAREAGCPRDQLDNFLRAGIVLQPRQLAASAAARLCDLADGPTKIGFGGARGGGKSHWALSQVIADDCARYPGLKWLYLRKVGKAGAEAITDLRRSVLAGVPHNFHTQKSRITRSDNGSMVICGHFQCEKDVDAYLGLEYDGVLIEEATQLSARKVKDIGTCVRTSKPGWRPRMYFTTNPGNIGHAWFKALFIKPLRDGAESDTRFIQSTVRDNSFVNAEYRGTLEALTGWQRKAWLDGDWDLAAGQFFTNFRRDLVVRELGPLPTHWRVWGGLDYGRRHYTVFYLLAEDDDRNVWVVDEHAEREWAPAQHAQAIHALLGRHGLKADHLEVIAAGWDCFNADRNGKSIADDYAALGLTLARADADRVNGAGEFFRRLGAPEASPPIPPTLAIDPRCPGLIDCLPSLQHSETKHEDVMKVDCDDDGLGGDDYYDSARYALMYAARDRRLKAGDDPFGEDRF